jgi:hypothetical protein
MIFSSLGSFSLIRDIDPTSFQFVTNRNQKISSYNGLHLPAEDMEIISILCGQTLLPGTVIPAHSSFFNGEWVGESMPSATVLLYTHPTIGEYSHHPFDKL